MSQGGSKLSARSLTVQVCSSVGPVASCFSIMFNTIASYPITEVVHLQHLEGRFKRDAVALCIRAQN